MVARLLLFLVAFCLGIGFWYWLTVRVAGADHNVYLPGLPTPYIQNILTDGETAWCVNAAAAQYPNFLAGMRETYDSADRKLGGLKHREIPGTYETAQAAKAAGCDSWHVGRYDNFCSGCAGNIHYANWPMQTNYKLSLGYFEWKTTAGHEDAHGYGLHEQYRDSGGGIGCDAGYQAMINRLGFATVMSCGTGVWELQPTDIDRICSLWGTSGDRFTACAPVDCSGPTVDWGGGVTATWDGCLGQWVGSNGYSFEVATGIWYDHGVRWLPCTAWGGRDNPDLGLSVHGGVSVFSWAYGRWFTAPGCS